MQKIYITKRNGGTEPLDLDKIHKVLTWACEGLTGVSISEIELKSQIKFFPGIKSAEIQETLIKTAADLISEDAPNYQYVAGRLINYHLRKNVYGTYSTPDFHSQISKLTDSGYYDPAFLTFYTREEIDFLGSQIKHELDNQMTYAAMEQFRGKYLVKNRVTGDIYETPQFAYMLIAMFLFKDYAADVRINYVVDYYNAISQFAISLPTPIMSGVRTPQRQFSSCVLIESADDLDSIFTTAHAIGKYVANKAGIGIGAGSLRALGSKIRNGDTSHTGVIHFYRMWQAAVKSCSQGGVRGGAATLYYPIWHLEVEDLLVLKNNKGTEFNRVRHLDYGVQFSKLFYMRLIEGKNITLFSPNDVPGLYDAFFADQDLFERLYINAEKDPNIRKKSIPASQLFSSFMQERKDTGRIYLMNVDHVNDHSSFKQDVAPIRQSNLCAEITLPTKPLYSIDDPNGEISLCTLSAINWGVIKDPADFEKYCNLAVRGLDALLDIQDYPVKAAYLSTMARRPLGIGIINFAYWLAKNDLRYQDISQQGLDLIDTYAQHWSYYLIKASVELAKEKGACGKSNETKYAEGVLPVDTYKLDVDTLVPHVDKVDWESLRADLRQYGIRNSTLMALMPAETSAQISNSTNGIEPPRALVSVKQSKDGVLKQVVPEIRKLKNKYDLLWDQKSPEGYLKIVAVLQKYIDQTISANTSYNPRFYPDEQVPMSEMIKHMLLAYKWGIKTFYYFNTFDGAGEMEMEAEPTAEAEEIIDEADCDSCKI